MLFLDFFKLNKISEVFLNLNFSLIFKNLQIFLFSMPKLFKKFSNFIIKTSLLFDAFLKVELSKHFLVSNHSFFSYLPRH